METLEAISTRRSIRRFRDRPVEWYLIGKILYAGHQAPTAGNLQDYRFMVVTNPDLKAKVAEAALEQNWIEEAPVIIVVFAEFIKAKRFYGIRGERLYTIQDSAAAVENMLLAAHDLGLGACWVGAFEEDRLCTELGIPDYARPQAIIPIGWPYEDVPAPPKYKLQDMVFFNRWGDNAGKAKDIAAEIMKDWAPAVQGSIEKTVDAIRGGGQRFGDKISGAITGIFGKKGESRDAPEQGSK